MSDGLRIWSFPGIYPYPEIGDYSSGIFIHKQNLGLKACGADVQVVLPSEGFPVWPFYLLAEDWRRHEKNKVPFSRMLDGISISHPKISNPKPYRLFNKPGTERAIDCLVEFLKAKNVQKGKDIIMAQWLIPEGYIALKAAKRLGIACAVGFLGDDVQVYPFQSSVHMEHAQWVLNNADLLIGCSSFMGKSANTLLEDKVDVHTVYIGIDNHKFKPVDPEERVAIRRKYGLKENEKVILNIGSAIERKGWFELFNAVKALAPEIPGLKILAVHGGVKEFSLKQKAKEFEIEEYVIDLGSISNDQLPEIYAACDVFCLPSHWEGLANVLCEAMASGCVVVTTNVSGHPEVVTSGYNGELVPPKNVPLLVESLRKVLGSKELQSQYRINARKTAVELIGSHDDNANKLLTLLKTVV